MVRPVSDAAHGGARTVVLIGEGDLGDEVATALASYDAEVRRLEEPDEDDVRAAVDDDSVDSVVVVAREDAYVLRMALMVRSASGEVPLVLTIFDQTMAEQVAADLSNTHVTSLADIVAPSLAGPCIDEHATAVSLDEERPSLLVERERGLAEEPVPEVSKHRVEALARALFTPYDKSAGLLLYGAIGLVAVFVIETITAMIVLDNSFVDAFYGSAKTLVTVDPNLDVDDGPGWHKLFVSGTMLIALVFAASFTAGLVNRVVERRLTGLIGRRAVPRRDHVVVVGLGEVGMKLCLLLRSCGVPVVAVEKEKEGTHIGVAHELGLPIVIGRGSDPSVMRRLSLHRARAVAAVTGSDLENISTSMTARDIEKDIRVVIRVGDGDVANETRSLLGLGVIRDVHRIAAALIASIAAGDGEAESVVCLGEDAHLRYADGRLEKAEIRTLAE